MRRAVLLLLCALAPARASAQDTAIVIHPESIGVDVEPRELPRSVADEAILFYNAPTTTRLVGRSRLPPGNEWRGDVAVRNGPVLVGGRIEGSLLVINGDAVLDRGAEITGDLLVIGGTVSKAAGATIAGAVREYRGSLPYRASGDEIVFASGPRRWLPAVGTQKTWGTGDARSALTLASGGTFNRIEGLPVIFGPTVEWKVTEASRLRLDALGVFRSAGDLSDKRGDLGYMVRAELRSGDARAVGLGFRAYDVVAPVEDWGLRSAEVGWSAFLFQRDYRDYYLNKGAAGRLFIHPDRPLSVALEVRREWQTSVSARDPWTVFRNDQAWRPNPPIDEGHYTTVSGAVALDTRNDRGAPTAGWWVRFHVDNSRSKDVNPQAAVPVAVRRPIPTDGSYAFTRGFLDVRRYTRITPNGRVNLRLAGGGWLGGDPLPLQQRVSLGGPDPMTGYAFRESACNRDIIDPAFAGSLVTGCDRVLLAQVEYRGHISLHWSYNPSRAEDDRDQREAVFTLEGPDLVVFGDAGQAWLVGSGPGRLPSDRLPNLGSWLGDLGLGVDWGGFGFYVAKAVTEGAPLRFTLRLDHRF